MPTTFFYILKKNRGVPSLLSISKATKLVTLLNEVQLSFLLQVPIFSISTSRKPKGGRSWSVFPPCFWPALPKAAWHG